MSGKKKKPEIEAPKSIAAYKADGLLPKILLEQVHVGHRPPRCPQHRFDNFCATALAAHLRAIRIPRHAQSSRAQRGRLPAPHPHRHPRRSLTVSRKSKYCRHECNPISCAPRTSLRKHFITLEISGAADAIATARTARVLRPLANDPPSTRTRRRCHPFVRNVWNWHFSKPLILKRNGNESKALCGAKSLECVFERTTRRPNMCLWRQKLRLFKQNLTKSACLCHILRRIFPR
jgi:hypothetical protein